MTTTTDPATTGSTAAPAPGGGPDRSDRPVGAAPRVPRGDGAITVAGVLLALVLLAAGIVAVRDALVVGGVVEGASWIEPMIGELDGLAPQWWAVPFGVLALLLGVGLLVVAVRPRPRTGLALAARTGVVMHPRDVARLARRAAEEVDGVTHADAGAGRRGIRVEAEVTGDADLGAAIGRAVEDRLAVLQPLPRITVVLTNGAAP